ncbi:MAG: tRNA 2-selenouridine(34) synthase MnmH [Bacteroidales bacterium]|jgi:tRNA 2-selenouridine synthase
MKSRLLDVEDFLKYSAPLIDVRSPSEFKRAHIPGAINLPLLDDEMRHAVGLTYARKGRQEAVREGLRVSANWLPLLSEKLEEVSSLQALRIYCWRGGMRSNAMAFLAGLLGVPSLVLDGGYKAYRRVAHETFQKPWKLVVLGGMTGSGKTDKLKELKAAGQQVLDLEGLASHKGSVFGHLGQGAQPTTEHFENLIFEILRQFDSTRPVWVEDESITVGRCFIPRALFDQMQRAPLLWPEVGRNERARRLALEYGTVAPQELIDAVEKIARRLGLQRASQIKEMIASGALMEAAEYLLDYYDKAYQICINRRAQDLIFRFSDYPDINQMIAWAEQQF